MIFKNKEVMKMKRSVYSLVLMDDVIKAVDEQAYRLGTSRSNLINQILAEKLSCVTPEMRMRDIFDSVSELISSSFQIQQQRSASLMTMRSALEYRYRPTINYKVELERSPKEYLGTLKVWIRTQSPVLTELFNNVMMYRIRLESSLLSELGYGNYSCRLDDGSFTRCLINSGLSEEKSGEAIGEYIQNLHRTVNIFFADTEGFSVNAPILENEYKRLLMEKII